MARGSLEDYRRRRDFSRTDEPPPDPARQAAGSQRGGCFVVQKHDARRLHYDLRLEMDGVLKSWAVTRGPSRDPGEKRLAVHTEDHPMTYRDFEGTIPRGEYGGGTMMVWDTGQWAPLGQGDAQKAYEKGRLDVVFAGERLKGGYHLVRMGGKAGKGSAGRENWLLIKASDDVAVPGDADGLTGDFDTSTKTGRTMDAIAEGAAPPKPKPKPKAQPKSKPRPKAKAPRGEGLPEGVTAALAPQLCSVAAAPPAGADWLHEIKFDGYRLLVVVDKGTARVLTRNGKDWTDRFSAIAAAAEALPCASAVLDGEAVVVDAAGLSSFALLQEALGGGGETPRLYAFDLLALDGADLRGQPLTARKERLRALLAEGDTVEAGVLLYSDHIDGGDGDAVLRNACSMALEGIISKRKAAPYRAGRGRDWVKSKCVERQEFVVGGYMPPSKGGAGVGALVLGVHEDGVLTFAGKVGTGFTNAVSADLRRRLDRISRKTSPFAQAGEREVGKGVVFTKPTLVCEVEFLSWSRDGLVRQASFQGLRDDKDAADIVREGAPRQVKGARPAIAPADASGTVLGVRLSTPDKVLYADMGLTKRGLAEFVASVGDRLLHAVKDRPVSLVRCPDGPGGPCFFQRHGFKGMPDGVSAHSIGGTKGETLVVDSVQGLIGLVQLGVLEVHPWGARIDRPDRPDRMILDMDPDAGLPFARVRAAALEARDRLAAAGLESFVKVTGGKGLHVVVPLSRRQDWAEVKAFARAVAEGMVADSPSRYVATMTKAKRKGKVFVDVFRNDRGSTAVAAWSTRARPGAPVAVPVGWDELPRLERADVFTVDSLRRRLAAGPPDPWADLDRVNQSLTKTARKAVGLA